MCTRYETCEIGWWLKAGETAEDYIRDVLNYMQNGGRLTDIDATARHALALARHPNVEEQNNGA